MKNFAFVIAYMLTFSLAYSNPLILSTNDNDKVTYGIKDGWYSATVKYSNYNTGTRATYTLDVLVKYEKVVEIDFGNGGSVHSGFNNENYIYSGGYLTYESDYNGNITAATTRVTINDSNGMKVFEITIE